MVRRGRPPILDETKRAQIVAIVSVGCTRRIAAQYVGCSVETIRTTAKRNVDFFLALRRASAQQEVLYLQRIQSAASKEQYWRAAAWALERMFPERYGPRRAGALTPDQLAQVLSEFADILADEIADPELRQKLLDRLNALIAGLQSNEGDAAA